MRQNTIGIILSIPALTNCFLHCTAVCVSVVMRCKFSLSSHLHAGFYNGKRHIVLHNFTASGKVQSQEWY